MASRICWYCEKDTHLTISSAPIRAAGSVEEPSTWAALFRCDFCGRGSIAQTVLERADVIIQYREFSDTKIDGDILQGVARALDAPGADVQWLPEHVMGRRFEDVPEWIADAASEAYSCYSIRAYRAAVLLARSVVEAVAKDQHVTSGTLDRKIETLSENGLIRPLIRAAAHEIRHLGNEMAHGDFIEPVTAEDADDVLDFMSVLLAEVYQLPAQVNARQSSRAARKAAAAVRKAQHADAATEV